MRTKKSSFYEPLMELINKKDYSSIWSDKTIQEITQRIGKQIHHNLIEVTMQDGVYYTINDVYTDMYLILANCVDTYKPYNEDYNFINFKTFYIKSLSYLKNFTLTRSTLFSGERFIYGDEGFKKREFLIKNTYNGESDQNDKMNPIITLAIEELDTSIEDREINKQVIELINSIEHKNVRTIFTMILQGKTQYEIAAYLNVTQTRISNIIRDIRSLKFVGLSKQDVRIIEDIFKLFDKDIYKLGKQAVRTKRSKKKKQCFNL